MRHYRLAVHFIFETGSHFVALAGMEPATYTRMASNSQRSHPLLPPEYRDYRCAPPTTNWAESSYLNCKHKVERTNWKWCKSLNSQSLTSSDILLPTRLYLLSRPKQCHQLGTQCVKLRNGEYFSSSNNKLLLWPGIEGPSVYVLLSLMNKETALAC